uniref:tRNA (guanine-N(7)-)-methyltransferase n=1 Tax=Palpitomonas bilix TaxID=652834 RepID=A0A7S3GHG2_9EUKA|mmetsp:Transcript_49751/g.127993  ORF Transcript_49751/g.127993 Transcript_49751/m.127993 type:complete len:288 (+) Transcript_49751:149-1012(+)
MVKRRRKRYGVDEEGNKVDGGGKVVKKVKPEDVMGEGNQVEGEEGSADLLVYRGGTSGDFLVSLDESVEKSLEGEGEGDVAEDLRPRRKNFRMRAHCNVLADVSFPYPLSPDSINWEAHFPGSKESGKVVEYADVGCGYGGLLINLAKTFPSSLCLGMEIRDKVCRYVRQRIVSMRKEHDGLFNNASIVRSNAQKHISNFFHKGQLKALFFLFPDPQFKKKNHRRRIITLALLSEYAFVLQEGGRIYTATDVKELHDWMEEMLEAHPLFQRVSKEKEVSTKLRAISV